MVFEHTSRNKVTSKLVCRINGEKENTERSICAPWLPTLQTYVLVLLLLYPSSSSLEQVYDYP
jgi:hypothetical protein